ncbi:MAG TPA: metallophosphoesterase family protein [Vicinamibacterales bacterium]|nr:metallophosphoesterase family protein [Vicinamibacterales bacterium]
MNRRAKASAGSRSAKASTSAKAPADRSAERTIVGLISDTHGLLRPNVASVLAGVDLILHAGDVGGRGVLQALRQIAPVEAVYGNVDDPHDPDLAAERSVTVGGVTIHLSHGHEVGRPTPALLLARYQGDVIVFGHTHRAVVVRGDGNRLAVNPGAAGPRRFDPQPSVARLIIESGSAVVEIISLA